MNASRFTSIERFWLVILAAIVALAAAAAAGVWAGTVRQERATRKAQSETRKAQIDLDDATRLTLANTIPPGVTRTGSRWVELSATARLADMHARCHGDPFAVIPTRARLLVRCRP